MCRLKKNRTTELVSALYAARPSCDHLATDSVGVKLSSLSAPVSPVARLSCSPVPAVALVRQLDKRWCSDCDALSEIQRGLKQLPRLKLLLQPQTTLVDSYILCSIRHQEATQSPLIVPSYLDAHPTPSHENGDRAPPNPPSTR